MKYTKFHLHPISKSKREKRSPRTEVIIVKHEVAPRHGVCPHRHDFGRHNECKVCNMTKHQIKKMEKEMKKHHSQPVTWRNTVQQPVRR